MSDLGCRMLDVEDQGYGMWDVDEETKIFELRLSNLVLGFRRTKYYVQSTAYHPTDHRRLTNDD